MADEISTSRHSGQTTEGHAKKANISDGIGLFLIVLAAALPALLIYPFPSQDGPQHAFAAFALSRLGEPELNLASIFEIQFPLSSQGFVFLIFGLDQTLPFALAERLALALTLAAYPIFGWLYARLVGRAPVPVAGMLTLIAYGWVLAMGFYNFLLAFAFVPLLVAVVARSGERSGLGVRSAFALAGLMLVMAWLHLAVAVMAGVFCLVTALFTSARIRTAAQVVVASVPAAAYAIWATGQHVETALGTGFLTETRAVFSPFVERLTGLWALGPGALSPATGAIVLAGSAATVVQLVRGRQHVWLVGLGLTSLAVALSLAYLVSPMHAVRWAFIGPRVLFAATFALSLVSFAGWTGWRRWVLVSATLAGIFGAAWNMHRLNDEMRPLQRAVVEAPHAEGAPLLPLELADAPFRSAPRLAEPSLHLGTRLTMSRGGFTPYLFAFNRTIHSVHYRADPAEMVGPAPGAYIRRGFECSGVDAETCLSQQESVADRIAYYGSVWGELLLFHPPEVLSFRLREREFRLAYQEDGVQLWSARPAALHIQLVLPDAPLPAALVVRVGYLDSVGWVAGRAMPAGARPPVALQLEITGLLPGPTDVEVFLDGDGDGEPDPGGWLWRPEGVRLRARSVETLRHTIDTCDGFGP